MVVGWHFSFQVALFIATIMFAAALGDTLGDIAADIINNAISPASECAAVWEATL